MKYSFFVFVSLLLSSMMQFTSEKPSALAKLLQRAEDSNILFSLSSITNFSSDRDNSGNGFYLKEEKYIKPLTFEEAVRYSVMHFNGNRQGMIGPRFYSIVGFATNAEEIKRMNKKFDRAIVVLNAKLAANNVKRHNHGGCIIL